MSWKTAYLRTTTLLVRTGFNCLLLVDSTWQKDPCSRRQDPVYSSDKWQGHLPCWIYWNKIKIVGFDKKTVIVYSFLNRIVVSHLYQLFQRRKNNGNCTTTPSVCRLAGVSRLQWVLRLAMGQYQLPQMVGKLQESAEFLVLCHNVLLKQCVANGDGSSICSGFMSYEWSTGDFDTVPLTTICFFLEKYFWTRRYRHFWRVRHLCGTMPTLTLIAAGWPHLHDPETAGSLASEDVMQLFWIPLYYYLMGSVSSVEFLETNLHFE